MYDSSLKANNVWFAYANHFLANVYLFGFELCFLYLLLTKHKVSEENQ